MMMKRLSRWILGIYDKLEGFDYLVRLVVRLCLGLMFFGGALHKATHLSDFVSYFRSLHIPAPELQAPFVVGVELLGGLGLMLGLLTRPAALLLSGTMAVALVTAIIPEHHIHADWRGLLDLFYLPETLLLFLLGWLIIGGPGRASLDHLLRARLMR